MKTWFTADTHFGHGNILKNTHRPFHCIEEHDDYLISTINHYVQPDDWLFVLGDFAWKSATPYLDRINTGKVYLITGNHDRYPKEFQNVAEQLMVKVCGHKTYLSHYPTAYWPQSFRGSYHLYGHTHDQREETLDAVFPGRRSMDVGVDSAKRILGDYRPFSEGEIAEILKSRPGHDTFVFYEVEDEHRKVYQVRNGEVVFESPSMETRAALRSEVFSWQRNR